MANAPSPTGENEALWREVLTKGHHSRLSVLPSAPRCLACHVPFGGVGGAITRVTGRKPSRKNPNMCNLCDDLLPPGGAEVDIAILFADIRGSTGLGERLGPGAFASLLNRFYKAATDSLLPHNAIIDKMIGDEVMALFGPMFPDYRNNAVLAAESLMKAVGYGGAGEPWLPLGIGVHAGIAFVGRIGSGEVHDFTALGDTVNTTARLQQEAKAGEILVSDALYQDVADRYPGLEQRTLSLRGRDEPVAVRVLRLSR